MKSIIKQMLLIGVAIVLLSLSNGIKLTKRGRDKINLDAAWTRLFPSDPHRTTSKCKDKPEIESTPEEKKMGAEETAATGGGASKWAVPRKKENYYARKMIGWGPSAYVFDFIDDVLEKDITTAFKNIFTEAKATITDPTYKDPYTLENITQMKGSQEELVKKVSALMMNSAGQTTFDLKSWENSITVGQVQKILKDWSWFTNQSSPDPAKSFVDKYDFNGDGRLSAKEFIIGMIRNNKLINTGGQCKNCMEDIIAKTIDPIFMYLDCTGQEKINSESIWINLSKLVRIKPNTYNFFKCDLNGGSFRTSAINDFIMKTKKTMDAYINKSEFRLSILQGYWARHVDDYSIYDNCTLNMKPLRWNEDGTVDKVCDSLQNAK